MSDDPRGPASAAAAASEASRYTTSRHHCSRRGVLFSRLADVTATVVTRVSFKAAFLSMERSS